MFYKLKKKTIIFSKKKEVRKVALFPIFVNLYMVSLVESNWILIYDSALHLSPCCTGVTVRIENTASHIYVIGGRTSWNCWKSHGESTGFWTFWKPPPYSLNDHCFYHAMSDNQMAPDILRCTFTWYMTKMLLFYRFRNLINFSNTKEVDKSNGQGRH